MAQYGGGAPQPDQNFDYMFKLLIIGENVHFYQKSIPLLSRQQQRRQNQFPFPLLRRFVHQRVRVDCWYRLQGENSLPRREASEAADLGMLKCVKRNILKCLSGYRWPGALSHDYHCVLPRRDGFYSHVRHYQ